MTIPQELRQDIDDRINAALDRDGRFRTADLVTAIVASWQMPENPDEDKWRHCAYGAVSKMVADATRRFRIEEDDDGNEQRQTAFPDFEKIRRAYQIDGETVAAERMTVSQAMRVIDELRRVQRGIDLHINEMLAFIDKVIMPRGNGN